MAPEAPKQSARVLYVRASSRGLDPASVVPGHDAVLDIPPRHGSVLPAGVLIDDFLTVDERLRIDATAHETLATWRARFDRVFTVESVSLTEMFHGELFCDVFLPTLREVIGLRALIDHYGIDDVRTYGLDTDLVGCLSTIAAQIEDFDEAPDKRIAAPRARPQPWQRGLRSALDRTGVPSFMRGETLVLSYASSEVVLARMLARRRPRPVAYLGFAPRPALAARAALRGGWTGLPGGIQRSRAARAVAACVAKARSMPPPDTAIAGVGEVMHRRAVRLLGGRASEMAAIAAVLEQAFRRGRITSVLVPFDYQPIASVLICVAREHGVPVLSLQHGYQPRPVFTPGWLADHVGVWSTHDIDALPAERRAGARAVGNPVKRPHPHDASPRTRRPRAIVLVQHPERTSAAIDRRINARHLEIAARGLRLSRADWEIVIRPHPSDNVAEYRAIAAGLDHPRVVVDAHTPILDLLSSAPLCIASSSTVALQTVLTGTRVVVLNPTGVRWAPPLDGGGDVPVVADAADLAVAIEKVLAAPLQPGAADLFRALGYDSADPAAAIIEWLEALGRNTK